MVTAMPWPIPLEEELLETLQRFKAVDEAQTGTITYDQYKQVDQQSGTLCLTRIQLTNNRSHFRFLLYSLGTHM